MRYAILSDVHGNYEALKSVLYQIKRQAINEVIVCGDVVGYGPEPENCIKALRDIDAKVVGGNHDLATASRMSYNGWRATTADVWDWNKLVISPESITWLKDLPLKHITNSFTVVHGSPAYPQSQYLFDSWTAKANLKFLTTKLCFFGHTHVPFCFRFRPDGKSYNLDFKQKDTLWLNNDDTYLVNPGSVGQPRDRNRDAAYMIYDTHQKNIMTVRVPYNINRTQERINALKLPREFATRLAYGQ